MPAEKTHELCVELRATITLLDEVGETFWREKLATSLRRIENRDFSGITYLLGCFGGNGSFNDLCLAKPDHHSQLEKRTTNLYELVTWIWRHVDDE